MKTSTKIVIFLVVAFVIVIGITFATRTTGATDTSIVPPRPSVETMATTTYTLAQVMQHKTPTDCWTTVSGGVYDLTPFVNQHPGGVENIIKICGIDGTTAFSAQHGGQRKPEKELVSLKIGTLTK